jgi:hypothetical protein
MASPSKVLSLVCILFYNLKPKSFYLMDNRSRKQKKIKLGIEEACSTHIFEEGNFSHPQISFSL